MEGRQGERRGEGERQLVMHQPQLTRLPANRGDGRAGLADAVGIAYQLLRCDSTWCVCVCVCVCVCAC